MSQSVLVEILGGHGRVRHRERVRLSADRPEFTLGRGVEADVVVDDPHVAAVHAEVIVDSAGEVRVRDLRSLNGVVLNGRRVSGQDSHVAPGGEFMLGRTTVRVRTTTEVLAPEKPVLGGERRTIRVAVTGGLLYLLFFAYSAWLGAPPDLTGAMASVMIFALLGAVAWLGVWSILSRLITGEWRWIRHAALLFGLFAILMVVDLIWDLTSFALSLPLVPIAEMALLMVFSGIALYGHLGVASHITARAALVSAVVIPLVIGGGAYFLVARGQARDVNYIASNAQVFPPSLRARGGQGLDNYFRDVLALREEADAKRPTVSSEETEEY